MISNVARAEELLTYIKERLATIKAVHFGMITTTITSTPSVEGSIVVECSVPDYVYDFIEQIIEESLHGTLISGEIFRGKFDWASDTYIKDCVVIVFKV